MAKQIVYVVVERDLAYNDHYYDFTGAERIVRAFRSKSRAEAVADKLSAKNERPVDPEEPTQKNHVVMEAVIEEPQEVEKWPRPIGTR